MKIFCFDFNTSFFSRSYLEHFITQLKSWGYDTLQWELEDFVRWDNLELCGQSDSISKAEMAELLRFAESLGMDNIPLVQCLGHCEYVLKHKEYAHLADSPGKWAPYCPQNPQVRDFLKNLLNEYMELFANSTYIHLGCDEVWQLGDDCAACQKVIAEGGKEKLLVDHINFLNDIVKAAGKTAMIWADMLLIHPQGVDMLSKDIVMVDWRYELRCDWNKLWMWDEKGGRLIDESEITDDMRRNFGSYLYKDDKLNIFYTADFLLDHGFQVIMAGASACYPDTFFLGKTANHICNACSMMHKSRETLGYMHTAWTVHLFDYELQPAIEAVCDNVDFDKVMDDYCRKHFNIPGKRFFELCTMLEPRVLFSGAGSTGHGKETKEPFPGVVAQRLQLYHQEGILVDDLNKTRQLAAVYVEALAGLRELRKEVTGELELFDRYILAAEALVNRAEFGIWAASKYLQEPCDIDPQKVKKELLRLKECYLPVYLAKQTQPHAERTVRILFDPLLEHLA